MPIAISTLPQVHTGLHELLARRWSPRAFSSRPVEPEKLAQLFEAAGGALKL